MRRTLLVLARRCCWVPAPSPAPSSSPSPVVVVEEKNRAAGPSTLGVLRFPSQTRRGGSGLRCCVVGSPTQTVETRRRVCSAVGLPAPPAHDLDSISVSLGVDVAILESVDVLVPADSHTPIAEVYSSLDSADRAAIRKSPYKQLGRLLAAMPGRYHVTEGLLHVCRRAEDGSIPTAQPRQQPQQQTTSTTEAAVPKKRRKKNAVASGTTPTPAAQSSSSTASVVLGRHPSASTTTDPASALSGAVVAAAGRNLTPPPAPPTTTLGANDSLTMLEQQPTDHLSAACAEEEDPNAGCSLSTQMLPGLIPTFFVPLTDVVATLPEGYTAEHIEQLFATTNTLQIVNVLDAKFVRFVGAYRNHCLVDLVGDEGAAEVEAAYAHFKPDPAQLEYFLPGLEPRGEWKSLYSVVMGGPDKDAASKLPFSGPQSILFFSQMQHVVAFSPGNGGGLCIPMMPVTNLDWESSPCVLSCHATWRALEGNPTQLSNLWEVLPQVVQEELVRYFGPDSVACRRVKAVRMSAHRGWSAAMAGAGESALPTEATTVAPLPPPPPDEEDSGLPSSSAAGAGRARLEPSRGWGKVAAPEEGDEEATAGASSIRDKGPTGAAPEATTHPAYGGDQTGVVVEEQEEDQSWMEDEQTARQQESEEEAFIAAQARAAEESEGTAVVEDGPAVNDEEDRVIQNASATEQEDSPAGPFGTPSTTISPSIDVDEREDTEVEATLRRFLTTHGTLFSIRPNSRLALLTFEVNAFERQSMTLEQQLAVALERRNNSLVRKLRRKMVVMASPDNPLLEDDNLAKAIAEFLPPDRPLPWRALKKVLPSDILDLIPIKRGKKFFESYPSLFKIYEVHHAGRRVIQRGDLPPPDGSLRGAGAFDDDELLVIVASELARRPRAVSGLVSRLPIGVERTLHLRHGGVAQFCQKHPDTFAVVLKDAKNRDLRTAMVTLLSPPPTMTAYVESTEQAAAAAQTDEGDDAGHPSLSGSKDSSRRGAAYPDDEGGF